MGSGNSGLCYVWEVTVVVGECRSQVQGRGSRIGGSEGLPECGPYGGGGEASFTTESYLVPLPVSTPNPTPSQLSLWLPLLSFPSGIPTIHSCISFIVLGHCLEGCGRMFGITGCCVTELGQERPKRAGQTILKAPRHRTMEGGPIVGLKGLSVYL
jgi:hypothetical protein